MSQSARRAEMRELERGSRLGRAVRGLEELVKACEEPLRPGVRMYGPSGVEVVTMCARPHLRWWRCCARCAARAGELLVRR